MSNTKQTKGSTSKASSLRKIPSVKAREFKSEVKIGADGNPWVSIPNKNMVYSWQPYGGTAHDKYIEKAAETGDIDSVENFDDKPETKSSMAHKPPKETSVKKVAKKSSPNNDQTKPVNTKKKTSDTPKPTKTITVKYTKKTDKTGRIMYYNGNGKRTAKKNVPVEYL